MRPRPSAARLAALALALAPGLAACAFFFGEPADLAKVEAYEAERVRGSVGTRLEATFAAGRELHLLEWDRGVLAVSVEEVANDYKRLRIEATLRVENRFPREVRVPIPQLRLRYKGQDYPARPGSFFDPDANPAVRAGISRRIHVQFDIGAWIEAGVYEVEVGGVQLAAGEADANRILAGAKTFPLKVPGER